MLDSVINSRVVQKMTKIIENAVVIGATGLIGKALLILLNQCENCAKITAIVRHIEPSLAHLKKVKWQILSDFMQLRASDFEDYSHLFSCLGTTLKQAGSKQKFYDIDYGINAHIAQQLKGKKIHYVLISSMGANSKSIFYYQRVKGQLEELVQALGLYQTSLLRPSLLIGTRKDARLLEDLAQGLYRNIAKNLNIQSSYMPVDATKVAYTMVEIAQHQTEKFRIYDNLDIQKILF